MTRAVPITATVLGYPRIGRHRELKKAVESYWSGRTGQAELAAVAADLRAAAWTDLTAAGLDSIPINTFSYYDQVLDTAVLLNALPQRAASLQGLDRYFALARGTAEVLPLEMTKWFDTNYHYLVPEISAATVFSLHPSKVLEELAQARELGIRARPVLLGPVSFLLLSKSVETGLLGTGLLDRLDEMVPLYVDLLTQLRAGGADWVQLDEPAFVLDRTDPEIEALRSTYARLSAHSDRPDIVVASYFGKLGAALPALAATDIEGLAVDLVSGESASQLASVTGLSSKVVLAGVVDGRNIWRTDLDQALESVTTLQNVAASVAVSSSCSLQHVPYSLAGETGLDEELTSWLAFADEKVAEIALLSKAVGSGDADPAASRQALETTGLALEAARQALRARASAVRVHDAAVATRMAALTSADSTRVGADTRRPAQDQRWQLPALPTTTIGSFPQTGEIRRARAAFVRGDLDESQYRDLMRAEVAEVIALQEQLGLDVLVHGEPERNDMVQYFAEQLNGFAVTAAGWVQSYGSRCVRPPILFGDVSRPSAMTVEWSSYAQSLTTKPVKGMLTGPVTILAWSFVRDDQPIGETARQVALAIRDETLDLQAAGIGIIQVDEPALRELLPLRESEWPQYLEWAVGAFRLATSGVDVDTQIHTHLCYSEFGEVITAIDQLDADVTSLEAARSKMEVLQDLADIGYSRGVGPGVYDIHSPRVPGIEEIVESLRRALTSVPASRLWVNPDCGLKTRGRDEVVDSLANLVAATEIVRAQVAVRG